MALDALSAPPAARSASLTQPRVHNLYLHEVPHAETPRFRDLLTWLADTGHTFIPYGEGIRRTATGDIDRPYVTFSFDDGFSSNVQAAAELQRFGATGCFFVVTDFIGKTDLSAARSVLGQGISEPAMSWGDLEALVSAGHDVGNHTRSHNNLATLAPDDIEDQIVSAKNELIRRLGSVEHFAWPLGRWHHFSRTARDIAASHHSSVASAERGAHGPGAPESPWCPRRDHLMTSWPLKHMQYFINRSAATAQTPKLWTEHYR